MQVPESKTRRYGFPGPGRLSLKMCRQQRNSQARLPAYAGLGQLAETMVGPAKIQTLLRGDSEKLKSIQPCR